MSTGTNTERRRTQAPGRNEREGISLLDLADMFGTEAQAQAWFEAQRWPDGITCPKCGSKQISKRGARPGNLPPYRCNARKGGVKCGKCFSVKTDSIMHKSTLPLRKWAIATYVVTTGLKSVSSMKLHRDLKITQRSAWHMLHRIREAWDDTERRLRFDGEVEVDEAYFGGKESNKRKHLRRTDGARGTIGKAAVIGAKERGSNQITAAAIPDTTGRTIHTFVNRAATTGATIYTDESAAYHHLHRRHHRVNHSAGEYVRGQAHTNGIESFWAVLKRAHKGTFHHFSVKHLNRYVAEFAGRHNMRGEDTINQMGDLVRMGVGKRLRYADLIGPKYTRYPELI